MKYTKADEILPEKLLQEVQKYIQGHTLYIPKIEGQRQAWGTRSGGRKSIDLRNREIRSHFRNGHSINSLGAQYSLSEETIKKIVYVKQPSRSPFD